MLISKRFLVFIDFHSIFFTYYGNQWLPETHILQNILFFVQQKKESHAGLEQLEGEDMMMRKLHNVHTMMH